jgi:nucleotide-binding universal stress UspA family protein
MNKVLCPVDFSDYSLNALEYAANLLQTKNGRITLLHIFTEEEFTRSINLDNESKNFSSLKELAIKKLKILAEETKNTFGVKCDYSLSIGGVDKTIARFADQNSFDYIVMGTQGNGYNAQTVVGSRTVRTIKETNKPLITVPIETTFKGLNSVVYASDYSELDKVYLQKLVSFVFEFNSRIKVVHVSHSKNEMTENTYEEFKTELSSFLGYDKISYFLNEYKDDISHGIEEFVNEQHGDLLVLLKRKRSFLDKLISSSVSKEITYFTSHPLLIYKE